VRDIRTGKVCEGRVSRIGGKAGKLVEEGEIIGSG